MRKGLTREQILFKIDNKQFSREMTVNPTRFGFASAMRETNGFDHKPIDNDTFTGTENKD